MSRIIMVDMLALNYLDVPFLMLHSVGVILV